MARALFRGPALVFVAVDADMTRLIGASVIGLPVREVFCDPVYWVGLAAMDRAYRTGLPTAVGIPNSDGLPGIVVMWPVFLRGRVWGLATDWQPLHQSRPSVPTSPSRLAVSPVLTG